MAKKRKRKENYDSQTTKPHAKNNKIKGKHLMKFYFYCFTHKKTAKRLISLQKKNKIK